MATVSFPKFEGLAHYIFELSLDGAVYRFKFKYNSRDNAWYFNVSDANNVLLRAGVKVVNQWVLSRLWPARTGRPEGDIVTVNLGDITTPPTLEQLGTDVLLTYVEAA